MHSVIVEGLEEYMAGTLDPVALREFSAHLESCGSCRQEVHTMMEISTLFEPLRSDQMIEPRPGFYHRVMQQIGVRQVPSVWSWLSLNSAFGRRVAFASLLTLAVLGSYLVSSETKYSVGPTSPEAVMAVDQSPAGQSNDRDMMLVTLTSFEP